ncbi:MAG: hypothetical protein CL725_07205, partial [Chloroflexi bacterium]|nr:hypothetical protein [Chloroflexota bacterium]
AHYTGPSYLSPLVEVVRTEQTSDETVGIVFQALTKVGKNRRWSKKRSQDSLPSALKWH